jgi:universal stress protein A
MIALRTVLCPVDFSPATDRQVDVAVDLCRAFGAKLVLHHNRHSLGTGASVGWMWNADHHGDSEASAEAHLQQSLRRVPKTVDVEGLVTQGPNSVAVMAVADSVSADLLVLTSHGTHPEDHASITEKALEDGHHGVLVLHEPAIEPRTPRFASDSVQRQVVVAPTDLTPESRAALGLGFDLARRLPIELHLLHVLPTRGRTDDVDEDAAFEQTRTLVPPDVAAHTYVHLSRGSAAEGIAHLAEELSASCIVMGEHTRRPLRRWFSRDTSRAVLHQAHCPVWYVPGVGVPA